MELLFYAALPFLQVKDCGHRYLKSAPFDLTPLL